MIDTTRPISRQPRAQQQQQQQQQQPLPGAELERPASPRLSMLHGAVDARLQEQLSTADPIGATDLLLADDPSSSYTDTLPAAVAAMAPGLGLSSLPFDLEHSFDPLLSAPVAMSSSTFGSSETPSDILHYYQSFHTARSQLLTQSLAAVRLARRAWLKLSILSRAALDFCARSTSEKGAPTGGARHSALAASYMSAATQLQEQHVAAQQQQAEAQAARRLEAQAEEGGESEHDDEEENEETEAKSNDPTEPTPRPVSSKSTVAAASRPPPLGVAPGVAQGRPATILGASEMERAVQNAHQSKIAKEALETAARRRAEEDQRQQSLIWLEQRTLREQSASAEFEGENAFIHLQQASRDVPNEPLRVGIVGAGNIGAAIAEQILQQLCGLAFPPAHASSSSSTSSSSSSSFSSSPSLPNHLPPPPVVPPNAHGLRLFISTRRPDHPSMLSLLKRTGGNINASGSGGSSSHRGPSSQSLGRPRGAQQQAGDGTAGVGAGGPLLTVYFDNARLVTECNVVLVCLLPHQLQLLASTIRGLAPSNKPRSQLFFCITSSHSRRALQTHLSGGGGSVALAQSCVVLPHLMTKGSPAAVEALDLFQTHLLSAATQALSAHASFKHLLGPDAVKQVVHGCAPELLQEVAACFLQPPPPQPNPTSAHATPHAAAHATSKALDSRNSNSGLSALSLSNSSSQVRFATSPVASSSNLLSLSLPHLPISASRSTAQQSSLGLTPPFFPAAAGSVTAGLPKLRELREREAALQARAAAAAQQSTGGVGQSSLFSSLPPPPVPVTSSVNGRNQEQITINPNLALAAHVRSSLSASPPAAAVLQHAFSPKRRSQLFQEV